MTTRMPSYTVAELEDETGFDRRTIAYYVQEELLPRVGRRGPRTRYPKLVRDRLLFIRRVREAEEAGRVPPVSLGEMRKIFERVSEALIGGVADGRLAVTPDLVQEAPTAFRLPEMRRAALRERLERQEVVGSPRSYRRPSEEEPDGLYGALAAPPGDSEAEAAPGPSPGHRTVHEIPAAAPREPDPIDQLEREAPAAPAPEAGLSELLARLQEAADRRNDDAPHSMDTWTRIEISPDIVLSIRNIGEDDQELLERVRRAMRRVVLGGIAGD